MTTAAEPGSLARTHGAQAGLPRGRSQLPPEIVRSKQRERLLRATTAACAEKGFADMTVADIVKRARVSRAAFYEHFADKEECFLAASEEGVTLMFSRLAAATEGLGRQAGAVDRLRAGLRAYLEFLAAEPEFARTFLVDALASGPTPLCRFTEVQQQFVATNQAWYERACVANPDWRPIPVEAHWAVVGALHEFVASRARIGETGSLPGLVDVALQVHLAIVLGWQRAGDAVADSTRTPGTTSPAATV